MDTKGNPYVSGVTIIAWLADPNVNCILFLIDKGAKLNENNITAASVVLMVLANSSSEYTPFPIVTTWSDVRVVLVNTPIKNS